MCLVAMCAVLNCGFFIAIMSDSLLHIALLFPSMFLRIPSGTSMGVLA